MLVQHIPQMLNRIEIWRIWRPGQHREHFIMFLKPFPNDVCSVAGRIILLKEATAIRNTIAMKGCTSCVHPIQTCPSQTSVLSRQKPSTIPKCASLPALDLDPTNLSLRSATFFLGAPSLSCSISSMGHDLRAPNPGRRGFLTVCCGFRGVFHLHYLA